MKCKFHVCLTQNYMSHLYILLNQVTVIWVLSSFFSRQSDRLWSGSAAWWRNPSQSQWPRFWRGCAGSSTSLWSSSQRTSSSTRPWTNGLCATASSLSTPKVTVCLLSDTSTAHAVGQWNLFTHETAPLLWFTLSVFHWGCLLANSISAVVTSFHSSV